MKTRRKVRITLPLDLARDARLQRLAVKTGFGTANLLLRHVANEVAYCEEPPEFYRTLAGFYEMSRRRREQRVKDRAAARARRLGKAR